MSTPGKKSKPTPAKPTPDKTAPSGAKAPLAVASSDGKSDVSAGSGGHTPLAAASSGDTSSVSLAAALPGSAAQTAGRVQPGGPPLSELNKRSGQIAGWTIVVRQPFVDEYEYMWQGEARSGKMFNCLFVSVENPTEYCMG